MKTSELTGALLDYWVARATEQCAGLTFERRDDHIIGMGEVEGASVPCVVISDGNILKKMRLARDYDCMVYEPSASWSQGGPLIERARIELLPGRGGWEAGMEGTLEASGMGVSFCGMGQTGATPLVAGMRAYVAGKFGANVPDEI